ncbi:MAG: hypothetical protein J3Q66DRAFT_338929 [Benniella sp.]|nr:MAG: hypothetical protein J3Q66DRAFT_338929 [Benniella sp.]
MASILFDDITFPRELYDPDTFEFVPPVSTLLAFTPHILSQLAKPSESEQEPLPIPASSRTADGQETDKKKDRGKHRGVKEEPDTNQHQQQQRRPSSGIFSAFQSLASNRAAHSIIENGFHLAGRYMDGAGSKASSSSSRSRQDQEQRSSWFEGSSWFGHNTSRHREQQERERLKEMEQRVQQMERDMRHTSALARSEIEAQRRERYKLEQELETQKQRVKKLEAEMEEERREAEKARKKKEQEEEVERKKEAERKRKVAQKTKSQDGDGDDKDGKAGEDTALLTKSDADASTSLMNNPLVMATVGVASLAVSLYSAHKASSTYSVVNFHDQLEQLMAQCESAIQSTEAWISEQFLEVPDQVREDLKLIKELMDTIQRLDPRTEKKGEAVAWSMSAVGSLGAMGGVVIGSMTAMASGGTLVLGCALYGIVARAKYNGPEYKGVRTMMELKAAQTLKSLGVNPASSTPTTLPSTGRGNRTSLIHESRIERLKLEFEKRDGLDIRDADEIDGLVVEEALRESSFSAPFVSQRAARLKQQSSGGTTTRLEDLRSNAEARTDPMRMYGYA